MKVEKKVSKPTTPPVEFVITLTKEEARDLLTVVGNICGTGGTIRTTTDRLYNGLIDSGVVSRIGFVCSSMELT